MHLTWNPVGKSLRVCFRWYTFEKTFHPFPFKMLFCGKCIQGTSHVWLLKRHTGIYTPLCTNTATSSMIIIIHYVGSLHCRYDSVSSNAVAHTAQKSENVTKENVPENTVFFPWVTPQGIFLDKCIGIHSLTGVHIYVIRMWQWLARRFPFAWIGIPFTTVYTVMSEGRMFKLPCKILIPFPLPL